MQTRSLSAAHLSMRLSSTLSTLQWLVCMAIVDPSLCERVTNAAETEGRVHEIALSTDQV